MIFSEAIKKCVEDGSLVRRRSWPPDVKFIVYISGGPPIHVRRHSTLEIFDMEPRIALIRHGTVRTYIPDVDDMVAIDWEPV